MPCYKPLTAYRTDDGNIVWAERGRIHSTIQLSCGQCIGCRLEKSRQWAIRCIHEAKMHRFNSFITLTYKPEHLPENNQLQYRDVQLFFKRTRESASRGPDIARYPQHSCANAILHSRHEQRAVVRYYMAGEYGEQFGRPHYHVCLFGIDFADKIYLAKSPTGNNLYRSPTLEKLWPLGLSSIGELTFESAAYTARYIMKKVTGSIVTDPDTLQQVHSKALARKHYEKLNPITGEIYQQIPEFNQMSRGQGIGLAWLKKYSADVYTTDNVIIRGKKSKPPRYYDKKYRELDPLAYEQIEYGRYIESLLHTGDNTPERLKTRETVAQAKIQLLKRKL